MLREFLATLTLIELGSRRTVKYRGPFSFDLAFTRSPGICVVCHRVLWFREFAQNGAAPLFLLERARKLA
jgi:hypothetical protein